MKFDFSRQIVPNRCFAGVSFAVHLQRGCADEIKLFPIEDETILYDAANQPSVKKCPVIHSHGNRRLSRISRARPHLIKTGSGAFKLAARKETPGKCRVTRSKKEFRGRPRAMLSDRTTDADLARPLVAIADTWTEVKRRAIFTFARWPKNERRSASGGRHADRVRQTITISDGITMGTEGMKAVCCSREVIADSIELFTMAHSFDAVVALAAATRRFRRR